MRKLLFVWLRYLVIISACFILCYTTTKQLLYDDAYRDQYALAEQAVERLNQGQSIEDLVSHINIETSKQCFIVVYDMLYAISYTNARYQDQPLTIPLSLIFANDDLYHEDVYTPDEDLRYALVSTTYNDGHIVVGKSLASYEEKQASYLHALVYVYGLLSMAALPIYLILFMLESNKSKDTSQG